MERKDDRPAPTRSNDATGRRLGGMADTADHMAQVRPESVPKPSAPPAPIPVQPNPRNPDAGK